MLWIVVSAGLLFVMLNDVHPDEVFEVLGHTVYPFLGLALVSVAINVLAKTARWRVMFLNAGRRVGFSSLLGILLTGQTLNWFLPGRIGDLSRVLAAGKHGAGRAFVLGTLGLEKFLDSVCYGLLFIYAAVLLPLPRWLSNSGFTLIVLIIILVLVVLSMAARPKWYLRAAQILSDALPSAIGKWLMVRLKVGFISLEVLNSRWDTLKLALWSVVIWGTAMGTNHLVGMALGLKLPLSAALMVLIVLQAGISLPGTPGRIGIFQYLCILALAIFDISEAAGLSYGILLQGVVLVPTTLTSLLFLGRSGSSPRLLSELPSTGEGILKE